MRILFVILLLFLSGLELDAQTDSLTVNLTGIKQIDGSTLRIAVYNSKDTYFDQDKMFRSVELAVDSTSVMHIFTNLPEGTYAITIYHDEDGNGKMNRKWYGPPAEGYAFSNNYHSAVKPASFKDAAFVLDGNKTLDIKMVY